MRRWLQNGGWIAVLTVSIFSVYCIFYLIQSHNYETRIKPQLSQQSSDFYFNKGMLPSISFQPLSLDGAEITLEQYPEPPEETPSEYAAVLDIPEDETENNAHEQPEYEIHSFSATDGTTAAPFDDYEDEYKSETEILIEIRDLLKIQINIACLCIASAIVFMIVRPFYAHYI